MSSQFRLGFLLLDSRLFFHLRELQSLLGQKATLQPKLPLSNPLVVRSTPLSCAPLCSQCKPAVWSLNFLYVRICRPRAKTDLDLSLFPQSVISNKFYYTDLRNTRSFFLSKIIFYWIHKSLFGASRYPAFQILVLESTRRRLPQSKSKGPK